MNYSINKTILPAVFLLIITVMLSCAGFGSASTRYRDISEIQDRNWIIEEIIINSSPIQLNHISGEREVYVIRFGTDSISGVGAPNRYNAPYTAGERNSLSIGLIAGTLMAPLFEPEGLKEHEYFTYLSNVNSWNIIDGKLELYSTDNYGSPVVLIYH